MQLAFGYCNEMRMLSAVRAPRPIKHFMLCSALDLGSGCYVVVFMEDRQYDLIGKGNKICALDSSLLYARWRGRHNNK